MKTLVRSVLLLAAILFAVPSSFATDEGKPAPALEAKLLDGASFSLAGERGHVVIINFWATWCPPCREEMPALDTYYRRHKDEGLRMVAISMDDPKDAAKVREVMSRFSFPAAFKEDADYKKYGRIWRMPMTFVVDRNGILRRDGSTGKPTVDLPALEKNVTPLLKAESKAP